MNGTISNIIFTIGLSLLVIHEMDAIKNHEWQMFPLLSKMNEVSSYKIFTAMHTLPFFFIFWALMFGGVSLKAGLIFVLNIFFIFHFVLHLAFRHHWNNEFKNFFSWVIITGIFLSGLINLIINFKEKSL